MEMTAARAIGPAYQEEWPGDRTAPLHWVARRVFELDRQGPFGLRVAAERHYEVYLNGRLCFRRRNFWNGDECVFGQTWTSGPSNRLRPGQNLLEVVVRSDPWRNKNHRCLWPFLLLEMHDLASGALIIASDGSWKVAVIDGWREMIALGGNGTIHFERVRVPSGTRRSCPASARDSIGASRGSRTARCPRSTSGTTRRWRASSAIRGSWSPAPAASSTPCSTSTSPPSPRGRPPAQGSRGPRSSTPPGRGRSSSPGPRSGPAISR